MATKYSQPQKENWEEHNNHLFTGSIMDPFKTVIANRPISFDEKSQFMMASFSSVTGWTETA